MEILGMQAAIAPGLHHFIAITWSGSSSPTVTTAVCGSSCSSRQCRPPLVLPRIVSVPKCHLFASALERQQTFCGCSSSSSAGNGLARVYSHAQHFASSRGGRELARAESLVDFSGIRHGPVSVEVELVCRVIHCIKYSRRRRPVAMSSLSNGNGIVSSGEGNLDLELELLRFIQQSSKPDAFPSRQDLISAGRADLARAIDQEGGWLVAGWDEEETSSLDLSGGSLTDGKGSAAVQREKGSSPKRSTRKLKARSVKRSSSTARKSSRMAAMETDERTHQIEGLVNGTNVVRDVVNAVDHKDARKAENGRTTVDTDGESFEDFSILERADLSYNGNSAVHQRKPLSGPSNDDLQVLERLESLLSFTDELKLKRPLKGYTWGSDSTRNDFVNGTIETATPSTVFKENSSQTESKVEMPVENSPLEAKDVTVDVGTRPQRKRRPRKKGRAKVVKSKGLNELNGILDWALDWVHQLFDRREKWMLETKSNAGENSLAASLVDDSKSTEDRIHTQPSKVVDTRAALQSVSEEFHRTGNADDEEHLRAISEFIDAEDTLEFRENAIMHARNELTSTRAQVAALEGNLKVEIMEARKILDETIREVERTKSISQHLRTARIVWPNPANEVYLTGSFNGWNSQVKLEKSSAGVFTCSLPLYPGKYEIKFVVDGSWRVDTQRPIVYVGGFENNVLTVS
ncbi:unnamed protein product [Calypogeia fissa]